MPEIDVQSWLHNLARVVREKGDDVPKIAGRPTPSAVHLYRAAALYDRSVSGVSLTPPGSVHREVSHDVRTRSGEDDRLGHLPRV